MNKVKLKPHIFVFNISDTEVRSYQSWCCEYGYFKQIIKLYCTQFRNHREGK